MNKVQRYLDAHFPFIHLSKQQLPRLPQLALWLVDKSRLNQKLSQEEMMAIINEPAYWSFCWASGQVLAQYLIEHPEWVAGKRVLDFGAGSGVVAIAAMLAGAKEAIACDIDPIAEEIARENAALNGVELSYLSDLDALDEPIDLVLAADVLYAREHYGFPNLLKSKGHAVLLADSRAKTFPDESYQLLEVQECKTWPDLNEWEEFNQVRLYAYGQDTPK